LFVLTAFYVRHAVLTFLSTPLRGACLGALRHCRLFSVRHHFLALLPRGIAAFKINRQQTATPKRNAPDNAAFSSLPA